LAAGLALVLSLAGCLKLDRLLFVPWKVDEYLRPADVDSTAWRVRWVIPESLYREVELVSSGGNRIYGFLVQPAGGQARDGVTFVYCHGNSHCINRYWGRVELLWQLGYRVFIFDYQGYGRSEGSPAGDACLADGRAALRFVRSLPEVDTGRIVYYGWSMGTFIATSLAADSLRPFGLILESPPASAEALVREGTLYDAPGSMLTSLDFDNVGRIGRTGGPVLMVVGREDKEVPPRRHALRIAAAACGRVEFELHQVPGAGHDDVPYVLGPGYDSLVNHYVHSLRPEGR
jgi:pimeloyl-ACP methyl ester carboxylesterase